MNTKKRVLVLTSTFPRWKDDKEPPFVFELCRRLSDKFDILVLAPHADGSKCFERMDDIDIVRFRYCFPRWERLAYQGGILANLRRNRWCYLLLPFFFLSQLLALRRILQTQNIDVIHAHWLIPQGLTVAIAKIFIRNMPPLICTSHGGDLLGLTGWLPSQAKRWVIRSSAIITVVSTAMVSRALTLGAKPQQVHTVSMGVDTRTLFTPAPSIPRATNEILFVGRLVEKKGCAYLLEAMPEILDHYPDARLSIVGDGPMETALKRQAKHLGIAHAVTFVGAVNNADIPELHRRASVLVVPSIITVQGDQEGLGLVMVEALACECPVVASDLPAIRDVIAHENTGLLVQPKNPGAIAGAVVRLFEEPKLGRQLAVNGRNHVTQIFDWAVIGDHYTTLIEKLALGHS